MTYLLVVFSLGIVWLSFISQGVSLVPMRQLPLSILLSISHEL